MAGASWVRRSARGVTASTVLALLAGCAGGPAAPPVGSAQDMPTLLAGAWGTAERGGRLRIGALNGKPLSDLDASQAYLSPGPQRVALDVLLCSTRARACQPIATVDVRFDAQLRRAYTARVVEQAAGSQVFRTWVVDDTGAIVAPGTP